MKKYSIIGLMSGTSLDGLDICLCDFSQVNEQWKFQIIAAETTNYPDSLQKELSQAHQLSGEKLILLHNKLGKFFGQSIIEFQSKHKTIAHYISSHGHTIFHQPEIGLTYQIGNGAEIAAITGIDTICDFRTKDLALGGHGAPLVPIGDELLFGEYKYCLNIGGIANVSVNHNNNRLAWDICAANMLLNYYAQKMGFDFDKDGEISARGNVNNSLVESLIEIEYHKKTRPKSLGREYIFENYVPLIESYKLNIPDTLSSLTEMIAHCIKNDISEFGAGTMLITGGGAFNKALIEKIKKAHPQVIIPSKDIVSFKEALIFAFLGLLRIENKANTLASVTGAKSDSVGACIYSGK